MNTKPIAGVMDSEALTKIIRVQAEQFNRAFQLGRDLAKKDTEKRKVSIAENALHHVELKDLL